MIAAEALVAVTGIFPKRPPQRSDLLAAMGLADRWAGRVRKFLKGEKQPFQWEPPPNADKLQTKIITPPNQEEVTGWLVALNEAELGIDYLATIQRGREHLDGMWPKIPDPGIAAAVFPLSQDDLDEVWSVCRVIDNPDILLDEILAWTLTVAQVAAWRAVYPELAGLLDDIFVDELTKYLAAGKVLTWQQEDVFRTLKGIPLEAPIVIVEPKKPAPEAPAPREIKYESLLTPAQRVNAK